MILFFQGKEKIYAVQMDRPPIEDMIRKLTWLFGNADPINQPTVPGRFIGPRKEMITPWSTNATEICQNMGIDGITRIEEFTKSAVSSQQSAVGSRQSNVWFMILCWSRFMMVLTSKFFLWTGNRNR
jgi:hypothetical protein